MGRLKSFHEHLRNSESQARQLTEAGPALNALFATEGTRLEREDEASRLRAIYDAIAEQLQRLRRIELSASSGHSQANLILSVVEATVTAIVSKRRRLSAVSDCLLRGSTDRRQPFGLVMVCIGPNGLPDDAKAISISQLARDSNRLEPEIVNRLQENGYLLFSEEVFSSLIDKLVADVRRGKLSLPVSREKLVEISGLNKPKSRIKIVPIE
jgi:hypothetical protein